MSPGSSADEAKPENILTMDNIVKIRTVFLSNHLAHLKGGAI